ncbi:MAG: TonB-dependent receptor [Pseudoxanthomonas sp.]
MGALNVMCLAVALALAAPAMAADTDDGAQDAQQDKKKDPATLDTVTVTAQHRSEDIQKVPTAITAVSAEKAKNEGRLTLQDAIEKVPGVEFQEANIGGGFYIRGIGSRLPGLDSPVSIFYDGIYQSRSELTNLGFLDVDRIEVLRGPQGTLYGRNNSGGTVNIITHDPVLGETSGEATVQFGNYDRVSTEAALNMPLGQTMAIRVAAGTSSHSGYLTNGLDDEDSKAARVKLLFQPNDDVRLLLAAEYAKNGGNGNGNVYLPTSSRSNPWYAPSYATLSGICGEDGEPACDAYQKTENKAVHGQLDWNLGWSKMTLLVGHQHYNSYYQQVYSFLYEYNHSPLSQSSVELRFASPDGSPVTWVGGLYWLHDDQSGGYTHNYTFDSTTIVNRNLNLSAAVFGQVTIPFGDSWRGVVGGRYTRDRFETDTVSSGTRLLADGTMSKFTYKVGVEHDLGENAMAYADVSTGYRQGGVGVGEVTGTVYTYAPETVTAYELGLKSKFLDNTVLLNTALFWYSYKGYQLSTNYYPDPDSSQYETRTTNVPGTSTIAGIEEEGRWLLGAHDNIDFSLAYSYNDYADSDVVLGSTTATTNMGGRLMPRMPKWKASLDYSHAWELPGGTLTARVGAKYSTKYATDLIYFTYNYPERFIQKAYTLYDASLSYDVLDGRYTISVFGNNLSNEPVITQANPAGPTNTMGVLNAPRTYGVSFTGRF